MEIFRVDDSSRRQGLVHRLTTWWKHQITRKQSDMLFSNEDIVRQPLALAIDASLNTSCNMSKTEEPLGRYHDDFIRSLADEGLLTYCNPISKMPVLSVCHGFLDSELAVHNLSCQDESRYRNSVKHLSPDKQESYMRLFSAQYPMEPLVDGLPGSVWLECVEPTLCILKALHSLKRRKSNLSLRKSSMSTLDSNTESHGDFEHVPHVFHHLDHGQHHRLLRVQFLALEGAVTVQSMNNQNSLNEVQEARHNLQPTIHNTDAHRRRRLRQYRPYDVLRDMFRGSNPFENNTFEIREIINNHDQDPIDLSGMRMQG